MQAKKRSTHVPSADVSSKGFRIDKHGCLQLDKRFKDHIYNVRDSSGLICQLRSDHILIKMYKKYEKEGNENERKNVK